MGRKELSPFTRVIAIHRLRAFGPWLGRSTTDGRRIELHCQYLVKPAPELPYYFHIAGNYDSGAPVFKVLSGSEVQFLGILWGGTPDPLCSVARACKLSRLTSVRSGSIVLIRCAIALGVSLTTRCAPQPTTSASSDTTTGAGLVEMASSESQLRDGVVAMSADLTNTFADALYVDHCDDIMSVIDRLDGNQWKQIGPRACAGQIAAIRVAPGRTVSLPIILHVAADLPAAELIGTFRVRLPVYSSVGQYGEPTGFPLPVAQTTSGSFSISQ